MKQEDREKLLMYMAANIDGSIDDIYNSANKLMEGNGTNDFTSINFEDQWDEIEDEFDWKKVHKVMTRLDWKWFIVGGVPTVEQLKETVRDACLELYKHNGSVTHISSGGFNITYHIGKGFHIEFILTEWSTF